MTQPSRTFLFLLGDIAIFLLSLFIMLLIDKGSIASHALYGTYVHAFILPLCTMLLMLYVVDLYEERRSIPTPRTLGRFILGVAGFGILSALFFYLFPSYGITPKENLAILCALLFIFLLIERRIFYILFSKSFARRIIFVGETPEVARLTSELLLHPHLGVVVATYPSFAAYRQAPSVGDMLVLGRDEGVREIHAASEITIPIRTIQSAYEEMFGRTPLSLLSDEEIFGMLEKKMHHGAGFAYRVSELAIALCVLVVFSPLLLLASIAIFLEDGAPVFYKQTRVGLQGKRFFIYKLRTMHRDAEKEGAQWATIKDARVTYVGRILRTTHIDEIPQMYNVIRGDIALVGPRPERPEFVAALEQSIPFYFVRHTVKPGFTGWAQIKYRYARTTDEAKEKFEYDVYYLRERSVLLDVGILAKTIQIIFTHA